MSTQSAQSTQPAPHISLTTAIPYVNAKPHLGHVLEWFQADALARYHRRCGATATLVSGADENSLKNVQAAEKAGRKVQDWLDEYAAIFEQTYARLGVDLTTFRRGSDKEKHWPGVQKLWQACVESDDIYKKTYGGWYCVGCEAFYTQEELVDGCCPEHLKPLDFIKEENYFFRLSKYTHRIAELIRSNTLRIVSDTYKNEMLGFVEKGLEDFSVSRDAVRGRGVGVPIPGDPTQVMYVWFDALAIYLTGNGYPSDIERFSRDWPVDVHCIGKGINRFHSVYWIGMLLSAGLPLPKAVCVHGYITVNGQKMSKSLGNVLDPDDVVAQYGLEPVRYYLLREIPTHADGDFSDRRFAEIYTAELANGLGNLCSRVATLSAKNAVAGPTDWIGQRQSLGYASMDQEYSKYFADFEFDRAGVWIRDQVTKADQYLNTEKPWKKDGAEAKKVLVAAIEMILTIAWHLTPFMPETAGKILTHFTQIDIQALPPLFPRLPVA